MGSRWQLTAPSTLALERFEQAALEPGWVRLRFLHCGICGSDMSTFEGRRAMSYPRSLGHEFLAEVTEVGADVAQVAVGELVTSDLNHRCGRCDQCRADRSHLCRDGQAGRFTNRAFAETADIAAEYLVPVQPPGGMHFALTEPLSCVLHALAWARLTPNDRVLVIGAGGLGLCAALALSDERAQVPFDVIDVNAKRLARVATACGNARPLSDAGAGGEYDVVVDLSGSESGLRIATERVIRGGRLCTMSHLDGYSTADFLLSALTRRDVTFTVSYLNGERENLARAAGVLRRQWSPAWAETIEVVSYEELPAAFARRRDSPFCKTVVRIA